ncbi:MAG: hypothetical protein NTV22_10520 [bacterium]|nr:hypothetical protein [bacterium]
MSPILLMPSIICYFAAAVNGFSRTGAAPGDASAGALRNRAGDPACRWLQSCRSWRRFRARCHPPQDAIGRSQRPSADREIGVPGTACGVQQVTGAALRAAIADLCT